MNRIKNPSAPRRSGFTLIELLVVIAIIAILAAILFPVFARARENARRASCQSNQKQIGLGILQYRQDYDEKFPLIYWNVTWIPRSTYLPTATYPYIKNTQVWMCPSNTIPSSSWQYFTTDPNNLALNSAPMGYVGNFYITVAPGYQPVSEAMIPSQSTVVMLAEQNPSNVAVHMNDSFSQVWDDSPPVGPQKMRQGFPHLDGANFLFIDGHVKFLPKARAAARDRDNCERWGHKWDTAAGSCMNTTFEYS